MTTSAESVELFDGKSESADDGNFGEIGTENGRVGLGRVGPGQEVFELGKGRVGTLLPDPN